MILGKPTGNISTAGDFFFVEVELTFNQILMAKMSYPLGQVFPITQDWLNKYKNEILFWIDFENGNRARPIVTGCIPTGNATDLADYPNICVFKTVNFIVTYNDKQNTYTIAQRDSNNTILQSVVIGDNTVTINSKAIQLGSSNVTEPGVLGNELVNTLTQLITAIGTLTVPTAVGPSGVPINIEDFEQIQQNLQQILSQNVKLQ